MFYYKNYVGDVDFDYDAEGNPYSGKVTDIDDLIVYSGKTYDECYKSFKRSVDDYITSLDEEREPISIPNSLYRVITLRAAELNMSPEEWINLALHKWLDKTT
jgi:predicted HicB family RNase H-like nuclease